MLPTSPVDRFGLSALGVFLIPLLFATFLITSFSSTRVSAQSLQKPQNITSPPTLDPPPRPFSARQLSEYALHQGRLPSAEQILTQALANNPNDDEVRFQLGIVQVLRAIEHLGQALYDHGAVSRKTNMPFLRLPVPENPNPTAITYRSLGRILDLFAFELQRAEATLAGITQDDVKLPLRLAAIQFDFAGNGQQTVSMLEVMMKLGQNQLPFSKVNPQFLVRFDRGDVAWLRAYCHLLSAMVEAYRSADEEEGFKARVGHIFPKVESRDNDEKREQWGLKLVDPTRLRRFRLHLIAVCQLNHETWHHIRKETDDDYEWLPHPGQTDPLNLPFTDRQIDNWLGMMTQMQGLLEGKLLIPSDFLGGWVGEDQGLNVAKLLNDPPHDLFNAQRVYEHGIDPIYLETETEDNRFDTDVLWRVAMVFAGPMGYYRAIRMN